MYINVACSFNGTCPIGVKGERSMFSTNCGSAIDPLDTCIRSCIVPNLGAAKIMFLNVSLLIYYKKKFDKYSLEKDKILP